MTNHSEPTTSRRELFRSLGLGLAWSGLAALAAILLGRATRRPGAGSCGRRGPCDGCPAAETCSRIEPPRRAATRPGY